MDLGSAAPLVVGADHGLAAKIRLLARFAPVVDLVTGMDLAPGELRHPQMRHITGIALQAADSLFRGRPLIIIETGDQALNTRLATVARDAGIPVNVPDCPHLCSFYLGAIVERDPVTVAISTSGFSPVLAQRLRARLEDMLPTGYGRLATYLNRIRHRLRHLPTPPALESLASLPAPRCGLNTSLLQNALSNHQQIREHQFLGKV